MNRWAVRTGRRALPAVLALLALLGVLGTGLAGGPGASAAPARGPVAAAAARTPAGGPVVLIGVPGLLWSDLDARTTPHLWRLVAAGGAAALSTRAIPLPEAGITCPIAGWLTVSAGQRAGAPGDRCTSPAPPEGTADVTVPGWAELAAFNAAGAYRARLGLLGQAVRDAGGKTAAVGPGAALAAADTAGRLDAYAAAPSRLPDWTAYRLIVVAADQLAAAWPHGGPGRGGTPGDLDAAARRRAVAAADALVAEVLARVPAGATILVAGVSDTTAAAHLHVAVATGPGPEGGTAYRPGLLTAASTRQDGLVTLTDLTATALAVLGLPAPAGVVGRPWTPGPAGPAQVADRVARLADADLAGQVLRRVRAPFFTALVVVQLLFYALAAVAIRRYRRMLTATRAVAVVSGAVPVATFLAQLVPWWAAPHPMAALVGVILGIALLIAGAAFAGPWRGRVLGPPTVVAAVTAVTLLADVATGSRLQVNAVTGYEPITGGRFYGFGNIAFAVYATGTLLALAGLAHRLGARGAPGSRAAAGGRPAPSRAVLLLCLACGLVAIGADGWPGWGADFGGVPAFTVGLAVFLLLLSGRRVSVARLAAVAAAGAVLIGVLAMVDRLRPADRRTHLGAFAQQVLDGTAGAVVGRKLAAMLGTLGNLPLTVLAVAGLLFLFGVLARPSRWGAAALARAYAQAPALRAGLLGALSCAVTAFLSNDSGIAIPAMALTVAVPLTVAASVRALQLDTPTTPAPPSAPAAPTARPAP